MIRDTCELKPSCSTMEASCKILANSKLLDEAIQNINSQLSNTKNAVKKALRKQPKRIAEEKKYNHYLLKAHELLMLTFD